MPLIRRGSVSARFSVWLRRFSTALELVGRDAIELEAAGIDAVRAPARPRTTYSEARFSVPASVSTSVPVSKPRASRVWRVNDRGPAWPPLQPARDHQMQHEPDVVVEADRDALAEALEANDAGSVHGIDRRLDAAQQERRKDAASL